MIKKKVITLCLCAAMLTGCSQDMLTNRSGNVNKSTVGGLLGAAGGAWIGSNIGGGTGNIVAIAAGTLLGAYAGHSFGSSLDAADEARANASAQRAFQSNRSTTWHNPNTQHSGTITPTKTKYVGNSYCREYTQTIRVGGKAQQAYGMACRQADGTWKIVK